MSATNVDLLFAEGFIADFFGGDVAPVVGMDPSESELVAASAELVLSNGDEGRIVVRGSGAWIEDEDTRIDFLSTGLSTDGEASRMEDRIGMIGPAEAS